MKKATINQVKELIDLAIANKQKNILFISHLIVDEPIKEWLDEHSDTYKNVYCQPSPLYSKNKDGVLKKALINNKEIAVIPTNTLELMNDEKAIVFMDYFGKNSMYGFEEFLDVVKYRYYINRDENGDALPKKDVSKMALLIAMAGDDGGYDVPEEYFPLFDEVYLLNE